jgi:radical SAM protein with 4Fe4S-binding SPASM domain
VNDATTNAPASYAEKVTRLLRSAPDFSQDPMVVFWETTRACALKCLHCRAAAQPLRHPLELSTAEGFRLLDELASFGKPPIVILTGGDPLMRRDIFELLEYGSGQGLRMSLSPSVTKLMTREALVEFKRLGISRLSFSLDGANAAIHDSFRGVRGSFDGTLARMQDALDVGLSLQINTVVSRHNLADLPQIPRLLGSFAGVVLWDVFFLVPTGRGQRDDVISSEEHEEVFHWLLGLRASLPFPIKTTLGQHFRRVAFLAALDSGATPEDAWKSISRTATNDGKGVCFVSHVGEVYPSGFLPLSCGNVRISSVVEIYRSSPVFQALRDPDRLKGKCGRCPFRFVCGGCRARAYAYTGDYMAAEPACAFDPDSWELGAIGAS